MQEGSQTNVRIHGVESCWLRSLNCHAVSNRALQRRPNEGVPDFQTVGICSGDCNSASGHQLSKNILNFNLRNLVSPQNTPLTSATSDQLTGEFFRSFSKVCRSGFEFPSQTRGVVKKVERRYGYLTGILHFTLRHRALAYDHDPEVPKSRT